MHDAVIIQLYTHLSLLRTLITAEAFPPYSGQKNVFNDENPVNVGSLIAAETN